MEGYVILYRTWKADDLAVISPIVTFLQWPLSH